MQTLTQKSLISNDNDSRHWKSAYSEQKKLYFDPISKIKNHIMDNAIGNRAILGKHLTRYRLTGENIFKELSI